RHVEEAKAMKPAIIVLVDRVLKYYVPVVLLIALGAFLFWSAGRVLVAGEPLWIRAMYAALSVLVMGYPCALGMATPLALIRGGGMAAERGILIRSGEAFQTLKDVDVVVLDKTGTITEGRPRVVDVVPLHGASAEYLMRHAGSAESHSEHPLARSIVEWAGEQRIELAAPDDLEAVPGGGVEARVAGRPVLVGKPGFLARRGIDVDPADRALVG
ncbi:MAG: HAD family hydrolase, partial [Gammaproteobacteria bacterium]|nr:HAD family hydrolase [Gemmatimonadota bacterium]NIU77187.1 HAD family hydrolase [Gammaproteobacteria bacterium]